MKRLLCLGDSYTIGEAVPLKDSFPHLLFRKLEKQRLKYYPPEIIAKTGWTTQETLDGMKGYAFHPVYDWVTVLSGVNNQYRNNTITSYSIEFEILLRQAIALAGGRAKKVIVLSIPDWGCTPFAKDRDRKKIATAIDLFNKENKRLSLIHQVQYIDICPGSRQALTDVSLVATDGLHPSSLEYQKWADQIAAILIKEELH
jgi:hypothetical protein